MSIKGISPLVATVLLIAFTIAIATLLSIWLTNFTRETAETVEEEARRQMICSRGGISLSSLKFNSTINYLSGRIENTGTIGLGAISMQIVYTNLTIQKNDLCLAGGVAISCTASNLTILPRELYAFNISASSTYNIIRVLTNCSSVYDEASAADVS